MLAFVISSSPVGDQRFGFRQDLAALRAIRLAA
jgi:hypothetical protein